MARELIVHTANGPTVQEGLFGGDPRSKPAAVTGSRANIPAVTNLLAALAAENLVTDSTSNPANTVSGSRGGNAALASLLTVLANAGIIVDGTSA